MVTSGDQMGWPNEYSVHHLFWEIEGSEPSGFEPWSNQTNDFEIDIGRLLARHSALLGDGKDGLAQCQDNGTELDIRSWCWWPGVPLRQHYKPPEPKTQTINHLRSYQGG